MRKSLRDSTAILAVMGVFLAATSAGCRDDSGAAAPTDSPQTAAQSTDAVSDESDESTDPERDTAETNDSLEATAQPSTNRSDETEATAEEPPPAEQQAEPEPEPEKKAKKREDLAVGIGEAPAWQRVANSFADGNSDLIDVPGLDRGANPGSAPFVPAGDAPPPEGGKRARKGKSGRTDKKGGTPQQYSPQVFHRQMRAALRQSDGDSDAASKLVMSDMVKRMRAQGVDVDRMMAKPKPTPKPVETVEYDGFENRTIRSEDIEANDMVETATEPTSTFGVDVDTGAYTLARARLREGYLPKPEQVRIEEFLNYFHYEYPQPSEGAFSVALEAAPNPFDANRHLLRVGVQGKNVPDDERPPAHLTFLLDVSGSMFGPDKLGLAREALELVTRNLRENDTVAIVTYSREADVQMWPAGAKESDIILKNIAAVEPGGSSALDTGLELAYQVAGSHFVAGDINRVVVMSDGRANIGETDPAKLIRSVRAGVEDGVMLSTIGFGAESFNDQMMERLADNGDGNYFFVDSFREAERVFRDRLCGTLHAIASDVKIQVEFDRNSVVRHRLIGYENRKLEREEFRDDSVDAGEIGAGHSVTALYEVELLDEPAPTVATVRVRYKEPGQRKASENEFVFRKDEIQPAVHFASADFKFAAAVALFAEVVRRDSDADAAKISLIEEIASEGLNDPDSEPDRAEFLELVAEAKPYFEL